MMADDNKIIQQEGLAVASIARDDPLLFPAMIPSLVPNEL